MMQKLKALISICFKSGYFQGSKNRVLVKFHDQEKPALLILPYGTHAKIPDQCFMVKVQQDANEECLMVIPSDPNNYDTLQDKEVSYGIPTLKSRVYFDNQDNIILKNVTVFTDTNFLASYTELKAGFDQLKQDLNTFISVYNGHTHTIPTGNSGTPSSPGVNSSASINNSKITGIKVNKP
jgi:hypothetical protein